MDGRKDDHRPGKRIRLEHSFESRAIALYSPSQHATLHGGCDRGVHAQAPPSWNLEEVGNINPSISTHKTNHHLTVDYHFTQCTRLDYQSSKTPGGSNKSLSPSDLSATDKTPSDHSNGLSSRDSTDQVCFGMVCLPLLQKSLQYATGRM